MSSEKPNLLCIDDEKRILRSLKALFKSTHNVYTTNSPDEFEELLLKHDIQVIISDQRMPEETGTELLRFAKEVRPNAVRILLTGYADTEAVIDSVNESEVFRYITKPWDIDELQDIVNQATEIALMGDSSPLHEVLISTDTMQPTVDCDDCPSILYVDKGEKSSKMILRNFAKKYCVKYVHSFDGVVYALKRRKFSAIVINEEFKDDTFEPLLHFLTVEEPFTPVILLSRLDDAETLIDLVNTSHIAHVHQLPASSKLVEKNILQAIAAYGEIRQHPESQLRHLHQYLNDSLTEEQKEDIRELIAQLSSS